jgi:hypothetical protein
MKTYVDYCRYAYIYQFITWRVVKLRILGTPLEDNLTHFDWRKQALVIKELIKKCEEFLFYNLHPEAEALLQKNIMKTKTRLRTRIGLTGIRWSQSTTGS